ncbi:leucine-rich repeat-containing protein 59 [Caerostris extrusa]|uniref:Leucine-rich repeat protein soc-2 homolog n=1 Tax=Caerostris extrusa TaxID=172846 RepID=A0AAV4RKM5_CAEEX|nr:leucine-rich repeat-containing protein 59 [Caerostris extrusa]
MDDRMIFATLTHLVKIDLSKNKLTELPANFGNLLNLQYLDLYGNQVTNLPVSFCKLKNLRWLDLKNNPLEPKLKNVAGDCLNEKECQECAKKKKEAIERAKIEKELVEQRRLKKLEKEKRKAESKAKRQAQVLETNDAQSNNEKAFGSQNDTKNPNLQTIKYEGLTCMKIFMYIFIILCLTVLLVIQLGIHLEYFSVSDVKFAADEALVKLQSFISNIIKLIIFYVPKIKEFCLKLVHCYMTNVTYYASQIEQLLALYF